MTTAGPAYVTAMGKFLPGEPVGNDEIEARRDGQAALSLHALLRQRKREAQARRAQA